MSAFMGLSTEMLLMAASKWKIAMECWAERIARQDRKKTSEGYQNPYRLCMGSFSAYA